LVWTISLKKTKRNTVVAQNASHRSDADISVNIILEALNEENHSSSEEIKMVERRVILNS
jgi:hypothetical protein